MILNVDILVCFHLFFNFQKNQFIQFKVEFQESNFQQHFIIYKNTNNKSFKQNKIKMKQSQNRSIYSLNTQKSGGVFQNSIINKPLNHNALITNHHLTNSINEFSPTQQPNLLQPLFYQLLQQHSQQYPYLSKILYLQLLLRENILLISNRRQQIKQIWKSICKKLLQQKPNIFVIDETTNIDEILNIKSDYNMVLVFDISKLNNYGLNKLLNHDSELSILAVEGVQSFNSNSQSTISLNNNKSSISQELKGVFAGCFIDEKQQNFDEMINTLNQKQNYNIFSKDRFHEMIRNNFQMALQSQNNLEMSKQQGSFLKPYLILLKSHLQNSNITFPHSKWKKMTKILQFISVSKHQGLYKKMSLSDFCITQNFLGSTRRQIEQISKANQLCILQMINYYGKNKFITNLQNHFWISKNSRNYYLSLVDKYPSKVTFFYACSKYTETAKIEIENYKAFYRIKGFQKKLMSDKFMELPQQENYQFQLKLSYRSNSKVVVHFGIACFDQFKNLISPLQVCRIQNSAIRIKSIQGNKIFPTEATKKNLKNWNYKKDGSDTFAYQKCIGIYSNGNTKKIPQASMILGSSNAYSKQQGIYQNVTQQFIQLSKQGVQKMKQKVYAINEQTVLMNHIQQGSYVICQTHNKFTPQWKNIRAIVSGSDWKNTGCNILFGTKYVRILAMLNYNSGHPHYIIQNKQAEIDIKDIEWVRIK